MYLLYPMTLIIYFGPFSVYNLNFHFTPSRFMFPCSSQQHLVQRIYAVNICLAMPLVQCKIKLAEELHIRGDILKVSQCTINILFFNLLFVYYPLHVYKVDQNRKPFIKHKTPLAHLIYFGFIEKEKYLLYFYCKTLIYFNPLPDPFKVKVRKFLTLCMIFKYD